AHLPVACSLRDWRRLRAPQRREDEPRRRRGSSSLSNELLFRGVLQRVALSARRGRRLLGLRPEALAPRRLLRGRCRVDSIQRVPPGSAAGVAALGGKANDTGCRLGALDGEGAPSGARGNSGLSDLPLAALR